MLRAIYLLLRNTVNETVVVLYCVLCIPPAAGVERSRVLCPPRISILYISSVRLERSVDSNFLFCLCRS